MKRTPPPAPVSPPPPPSSGLARDEREWLAREPTHHEYGRFRLALIGKILADKLNPIDVAKLLEDAADRFPQVTLEECRQYRKMGETWKE